jgi:hypothetical protein
MSFNVHFYVLRDEISGEFDPIDGWVGMLLSAPTHHPRVVAVDALDLRHNFTGANKMSLTASNIFPQIYL